MLLTALAIAMLPMQAAPTYLTCQVPSGGNMVTLKITADEANQQVTLAIPSAGSSNRSPATFSADSVKWGDASRFSDIRFVLSRTDLSIVRTITTTYSSPEVDKGACKIETAPKRAF